MSDFHRAPLFCYGFLGFYVYALGLWLSRYYARDITGGLYLSLLRRGFLILILSLVVSYDPSEHQAPVVSRLFVFSAGVFPSTFITFVRKRLGDYGRQDEDEEALPLGRLRSISIPQQTRLEEEGINTVDDLANYDLARLCERTAYPKELLEKWCDQAILLSRVGPTKYELFRQNSIAQATELVRFVHGEPREGVKGLEQRTGWNCIKELAANVTRETNFRYLEARLEQSPPHT
jgi:hypothetical protein